MTALVIDASVAVKWVVMEADSHVAERLLHEVETLHAPNILRPELANSLWSNLRRQTITPEQAFAGLSSVERSISRWHDIGDLLPRALTRAVRHDHPVYDFCYIALAQSLGEVLVTADKRLIRSVSGSEEARYVKPLSDYA